MANFKPTGGNDFYVTGIFKRQSVSVEVETGREVMRTVLLVPSAEVLYAKQGDKVVVGGDEYFVTGHSPDGTGLTTLTLSIDAPPNA